MWREVGEFLRVHPRSLSGAYTDGTADRGGAKLGVLTFGAVFGCGQVLPKRGMEPYRRCAARYRLCARRRPQNWRKRIYSVTALRQVKCGLRFKTIPPTLTLKDEAGIFRASGGTAALMRMVERALDSEMSTKGLAAVGRQELEIGGQDLMHATSKDKRNSKRERKSMARKWLELAPWQNKRESPSVSSAENSSVSKAGREKENPMQESAVRASREGKDRKAEMETRFQVDLMPMEDIYRAAGIANPRKGYSIHKVLEMLSSQHVVGLTKEMKRTTVMVALEAADVSLGEVQQDAKARQEALHRYESEQTKLFEAEWARKAEETIRIAEELERVKAQYAERVKRNLDEVAREKALFDRWLTIKQEEVRSISTAVDLCLKREVAEPDIGPLAKAAAAGAAARTALIPSPTKA